MQHLIQAKKRAKTHFAQDPRVVGYGVGENTLRLYVRTPQDAQDLPPTFEDIEIEYIITGDIQARPLPV